MSKQARVAYKRTEKKDYYARLKWVKARSTGGHCFTISFDRLAQHLTDGATIEPGETVERFEIDEYGLTVFIEGPSSRIRTVGSRFRELPGQGKKPKKNKTP